MSIWHSQFSRAFQSGKLAQYFPLYERHFSRFKDLTPVVLEIGIAEGKSLCQWRDYFGPSALIVGVDNDPNVSRNYQDAGPNTQFFLGDQGDEAFLLSVVDKVGELDVVIDDGGHDQVLMRRSFETLFPRLSRHGIYLVEDTHTSYTGEGEPNTNSFVEYAKTLVDEMNKPNFMAPGTGSFIQKNLMAVTFYESLVVIEKGRPLMANRPQA